MLHKKYSNKIKVRYKKEEGYLKVQVDNNKIKEKISLNLDDIKTLQELEEVLRNTYHKFNMGQNFIQQISASSYKKFLFIIPNPHSTLKLQIIKDYLIKKNLLKVSQFYYVIPWKLDKNRLPAYEEMVFYRQYLMKYIELSSFTHILPIGSLTSQIMLKDPSLRIFNIHGEIYNFEDKYTLIPILNPDIINQNLDYKSIIHKDLNILSKIVI